MKAPSKVSQIRKALEAVGIHADSWGRNKAGQVVLRWGFFYRHGQTAQAKADGVKVGISLTGKPWTVTGAGEIWKAFRGGATVAQGSHFWVAIEAPELEAVPA